MLNTDLADELRDAQNHFCDRVFDNERIENEIVENENTEKWFCADELKKFVLYEKMRNVLRNELRGFKVSRGFVLYHNKLSPKLDLIIYQGNELYQNNDFVVVRADRVRAIIELVGTFKINQFFTLIDKLCRVKAHMNYYNNVFTGICAYHFEQELVQRYEFTDFFTQIKNRYETKMQEKFKFERFIDCISFSADWFMRYCYELYDYPCYEAFKIDNYGYDYLVLNLKAHLGLNDWREFALNGIPNGKMNAPRMQILLQR